jgi:hypothetical protein
VIFFIRSKSPDTKQGQKMAQSLKLYILGELPIVILTLLPLMFYLILRGTLTDVRGFSPNTSNLFNISIYPVLYRSFTEQFGVFILFFIAGCILLILNKEYFVVFFYILTFLFIPLFHVVDNIAYTGYSRFNLFILPVVLAGASIALKKLMESNKFLCVLIACAVITINLWSSPVYPDGSKQPLWGNYFVDESEHYYPYQETLTWLKRTYPDSHILFASGNYSYSYEFYFNQLNWHPDCGFSDNNEIEKGAEIDTLSHVLAKAKEGSYAVVVYQIVEKSTLFPGDLRTYHLIKTFVNDAGKTLVIYAAGN